MGQMTWRAPDELLERVRRQARAEGRSLNDWVSTVLDAASDPGSASSEGQRIRERLRLAGVLHAVDERPAERPSQKALAQARAAARSGVDLGRLVDEGRE